VSPLSLNDGQLQILMRAARPLAVEKRALFLERVGAQLALRGFRPPSDDDLARAVRMALQGLRQGTAA
jgi:hypothetical protein